MKSIGFTKKIAAGLIATAMTMSANATFMTITADGGFTSATTAGDGTAGSIDNISIIDTSNTSSISWGQETSVGGGLSSLLLTDEKNVMIDALDTNYLLSTLTHINNPITGGSPTYLDKAVIAGSINFSGTQFLASIGTLFDIDFKETRNETSKDACTAPAAGNNGETGPTDTDIHVHLSLCDDRFDYTVDGGTFPLTIPLFIGGIQYNLSLFGATDVAGNNLIPDNRFWTQEDGDTNVFTFARLSRVPEPASIAILGLGLLGLASSRKRKAK